MYIALPTAGPNFSNSAAIPSIIGPSNPVSAFGLLPALPGDAAFALVMLPSFAYRLDSVHYSASGQHSIRDDQNNATLISQNTTARKHYLRQDPVRMSAAVRAAAH
ncbi:MAG: hypothetical protein LZF86_130005 [Nitrospira sp.]|nr:MAG: hypothetical protein LZF86_130005 [Nitrospira sp.]